MSLISLGAQSPSEISKAQTRYEMALIQIALERQHFSCGFIDGRGGRRTARALTAFQSSQGLSPTGVLDSDTKNRLMISSEHEPFFYQEITAAMTQKLSPPALTWLEKSQRTSLGYQNFWELLAEQSHATVRFLKELNPQKKELQVGDRVITPSLQGSLPLPQIASIRISLTQTSIQGIDASGKIVSHFACSIAADKQKRPLGILTVKNFAPHPNYTFDPALFVEAARKEGLNRKLIIPPGPNNPVGTAWIGLSLPGYGIHGTPHPEEISATQSHGCFRLCNWNAEKLLKMIRIGMPVTVVEE